MSLTSCTKKAAEFLPPEMISTIFARAKALRDGGLTNKEASRQAVREMREARQQLYDDKFAEATSAPAPAPVAPVVTLSTGRLQRENPMEMSTRAPTAKGKNASGEDPMKDLLISDFAAGLTQPKWIQAVADLATQYPNYREAPSADTAEKKLERLVRQMAENLVWLHDQVPESTRQRSKLWYDGANILAGKMARAYEMEPSQAAGILAVLSPQKDWFMNVSLAMRVARTMALQSDTRWTDAMDVTASRIFGKAQYQDDVRAIRGTVLGELGDDLYLQAMWLRAYDEAHVARAFEIVSPEGKSLGNAVTKDGTEAKVAWGGMNTIAKAISIYHDGSAANIHAQLGNKHKVRNFYNNILVPNSRNGHVTIDTHAVAAALLRALSGNSTEVKHNFGGVSNAQMGLGGTYALYEEAYRRAAERLGILPRELQSITWEAIRGMYRPTFKSQAANVAIIDKIWNNFKEGRLSHDAAREHVRDAAGGIDPPSWLGRNPAAYAEDESAADEGDVSGDELAGGDAEDDGGAGAADSGAAAQRDVTQSTERPARTVQVDGVRYPDTNSKGQVLASVTTGMQGQINFWRWFRGSKTVDAQGRPLVVYHGTTHDFSAFDKDSKQVSGDVGPLGIFFTESAKYASAYTEDRRGDTKEGGQVMPVYVALKNPKIESIEKIEDIEQSWDKNQVSAYKAALVRDGHDGIIFRGDGASEFVAFSPEQIKSAIGNNDQFDAASTDITQSPERPHFYSQLQRAIEGVPDRLATMAAPQWKLWLDANAAKAGVKKDELEWSGLKDWLAMQGKAKLTREQVAEFVRDNGVQIHEVLKGTESGEDNLQHAIDDLVVKADALGYSVDTSLLNEAYVVMRRRSDGSHWQVFNYDELVQLNDIGQPNTEADPEREAYAPSEDIKAVAIQLDEKARERERAGEYGIDADGTRYSQYTLPGGENYREVLLTLPTKTGAVSQKVIDDLNRQMQARYGEPMSTEQLERLRRVGNGTFDMLDDWESRLGLFVEQARAEASGAAPVDGVYRSGHWDEPNILAHIRLNDRADADGKKVLFVEEIQSDWAQAGRKNGFAEPAPSMEGWTAKLWDNGGVYEVSDSQGRFVSNVTRSDLSDFTPQRAIAEAQRRLTQDPMRTARHGKVPRAPFIDKTEAWVGLALKRIIKLASDEGHDRVAFVNGKQSAERYDLSKQIEAIQYVKNQNGEDSWQVKVMPKGKEWTRAGMPSPMNAQQLEDHLGKDIARKIVNGEGDTQHGTTFLHNVDLRFGGEGMVAFYDKIVPQVANDILKKVGGGKVAETTIVVDKDGWRITRPTETTSGKWMVKSSDYNSKGLHFDTEAQAKAALKKKQATSTQPSIDITPEMRAMIAEDGLPLFSTVRNGADRDANLKTFMEGSKVVDDNGAPLRMYHGTGNLEGMNKFDPSMTGQGNDQLGSGFYFTNDPDEASGYTTAVTMAAGAGAKKLGGDSSPGVAPVYLSIKNPLVVDGSNLRDVDIDLTARQAEAIMRRSPDLMDPDNSPLWNWEDISGGIKPALIRRVASNYTGPSLLTLTNDFFKDHATEFRAAVRDVLGYDGVVHRFDNGRVHWVAWFPEQIKSATGNNGQFDANDPDITHSAIRSQTLPFGYQVADLLDSSKQVSWWDKTVGTPYHMAQKYPAFKRVYDAVQAQISDVSKYATRAADLAPSILPKLDKLADITRSPLSADDVKALADPIFKGTVSYARDAAGSPVLTNDVGSAGVVWTDSELTDMWHLNAEQIKLYREFRKAANKSIADMAITGMLRLAGRDGEGVHNRVLAATRVDEAASILADHLSDLAAKDPERANTLQNTARMVGEIRDQARGLMAKGYAPLQRFGKHTVYAPRLFEHGYFEMFETEREANKRQRELKALFPNEEVTTGIMSQESWRLFKGVTPEALALFGEALGLDESASDQESQVFQEYLKMAKSTRSAMKRLIERKGVEGYSQDVGRVLAGFVYSNARLASQNLNAQEMLESANEIPEKQGDLRDHAIKLVEYAQNPSEEAPALRSLLFANYIGGSVASALTNLTQSLTTTLPTLSMHFGVGKAGSAMAGAIDIAKNGAGSDADLAAAMKRAEEEGVTAPQEVHHLMAQAQGKGTLKSGDGTLGGDLAAKGANAWSKAMLVWGKMFGWAELVNRKVAFAAAYKLAREKGMENPYEFAKGIVADTQFTMNKGNNPTWARGPVGATLFTFKKFMVMYLEGLARMLTNGEPGSPERAAGQKAFALSLAIMFLLAGSGGFPFADDLDDLIDGFAQRVLGKSFSSKQAKREFFAKILGDAGADFVEGGVSAVAGFPIDFSGRLGMGNVIPGTGLLVKKQDYGRDIAEIAGAGGDFAKRVAGGAAALAQGELREAVDAAAPTALANGFKAADMWQLGYYRDLKGRKVVDTTKAEAVLKGIGFQPQTVHRIQEASGTQQELIALNKIRETEIADLWAAGRIERDPAKVDRAKQQLKDWNESNPSSPISIDASQINKRVQQAMMDKAQRMSKTAPKEIRKSVAAELKKAMPSEE